MINNRQAGRRRGRGGQQRSQGGNPNRPESGNRIDNRARGNAAQLLEKYRNLARDAQMQGDRVNTEYYHQFADHYFRVLNESRARFEESRRQREDEDEDDFENEGEPGTPDQQSSDRRSDRGNQRGDRNERGDREERGDRSDRSDRRRERAGAVNEEKDSQPQGRADDGEATAPAPENAGEEAPRRRGRPRRQLVAETRSETDEAAPSIDADRLPPSLGLIGDAEEEEAPRPRRRRKARTDEEDAASSAA